MLGRISTSEGQLLTDVMNDHGLEQLVQFITWEKNIFDLTLTSLPGQFQEIHIPDKLSDQDVISGTLKIVYIPPLSLSLSLSLHTHTHTHTHTNKKETSKEEIGTSMATQISIGSRKL